MCTGLIEKTRLGSPDSGLIQRSKQYSDNIDSHRQSFGQSKFLDDRSFHVNLCHQTVTECHDKGDLVLEKIYPEEPEMLESTLKAETCAPLSNPCDPCHLEVNLSPVSQ